MVGCMLGVLIVVIVEAFFTPGERAAATPALTCVTCIPPAILHVLSALTVVSHTAVVADG
jgi:hypothetical protein